MEMHDKVEIYHPLGRKWNSGYTYIAEYKYQCVVIEDDFNTVILRDSHHCRLAFTPEKGDTIMVQHYKDNPWEYRKFLCMDGGRYVCSGTNGEDKYYPWIYGKEEE